MTQGSLFGSGDSQPAKPAGDRWEWMRVLITVKAAPNPSAGYGETVCVAGLRLDDLDARWIRLYPINFRELDHGTQFQKYNIISLRAKPARPDTRVESWKPDWGSITVEGNLAGWERRRPHIEPLIDDSMCDLLDAVRVDPTARSLAAIRPRSVLDLDIRAHPGWTAADQAKIDRATSQQDLAGATRAPLEAPRFKGWYRYRCGSPGCNGHKQRLIDWEFVRLQRRLGDRDDAAAKRELEKRFLDEMCSKRNDVVFYVGNLAAHHQAFTVLGLYYPKRQATTAPPHRSR
ncbi:MAG: hypothetical protein ACRDQA_00425 [Nocardioidaceae bacterium]